MVSIIYEILEIFFVLTSFNESASVSDYSLQKPAEWLNKKPTYMLDQLELNSSWIFTYCGLCIGRRQLASIDNVTNKKDS